MMDPQRTPITIIIGKGRSGTTWLGEILNADPGCVYKYEPFLPKEASVFRSWLQQLGDPPDHEARQRFVALCGRCYHGIDNPPFVKKDFRSQSPLLLRLLFAIGSRASRLSWLYEWYGGRHMTRLRTHK